MSSPRGGSRHADSCGRPCAPRLQPETVNCTGITKPTWGPLPPQSSHGCRPLRMQEPASKCDHAFTPTSHPAKGSRDGTRACLMLHGPLPMVHVLHHVRRPTTRATTHPFRPSSPVQSRRSFPRSNLPASFILAGPWVLRNTMVRPPPDDNIVEWEPFSFPTASWAMLSDA